jgi:hypothetical protein
MIGRAMSDSNGQHSKESDIVLSVNTDRIESNKGNAFSELLDQVVSAVDSSEAESELRDHLKLIGERHPRVELSVNPVLVSLVDAVTQNIHGLTSDQRSEMNHAVAETLYRDADTRSRLERLWYSLRGE